MTDDQTTEPNIAALTERLEAMESILIDRASVTQRGGYQFGTDRDVWKALGYKTCPGFEDYMSRYRRQDIAGRIVKMPVDATWREKPALIDDEDPKNTTDFEQAWKDLMKSSPLIERMKRADTLACLGEYSVLLLGLAGQDDFSAPLIKGSSGSDGLLYITPFGERSAQIETHDPDHTSPRYGLPLSYSLQTQISTGQVSSSKSVKAHWSRVVHISQGNLESDILGKPVLEGIVNLLDDLVKVVGGSAETYWLMAKSPLQANLDSKARPLTDKEKTALKTQIDEVQHNLRRVLYSSGMDLSYISSGVADPRGPFETIMKLISAATGIPQRMLTGSEAGELASVQDDRNFADRIQERQTDYADPKILRPVGDMLIEAGVLPEPKGGEYEIDWGSNSDADEAERAITTSNWANAARGFSQARSIIDPGEVRERFFDLPAEHPNPPQELDLTGDEVDENGNKKNIKEEKVDVDDKKVGGKNNKEDEKNKKDN